MAIPATREALRLGGNLNFGAGGLSIGFLVGTFVKSVVENELTGSVTVTYQDADGANQVSTLEGSLLTDAERHDLNSIQGLLAKTADLRVKVTARTWGNVTGLSQGGFVSENSGTLGPIHAAALSYVLSKTATTGDANNDYVYIRIPIDRHSGDYRVRQNGSLGEFFITSWDHVGTHQNFDYYRSRHNLFASYSVTIQYDAATATQTDFRGTIEASQIVVLSADFDGQLAPADDTVQKVAQKVDDLVIPDAAHELTAAEANDGDSDVFGEVSGELVAGAIDAHHTTQYIWLTELRLDFRNPPSGVESQFNFLAVTGSSDYDRALEFSLLSPEDVAFIQSVPHDSIVNVAGSLFNVFDFTVAGLGRIQLRGVFDTDPALVNGQNYRLRFTASRAVSPSAADVDVDTSNLDGNLNNIAGNSQSMFEAIDDLSLTGQGAGNWGQLPGRPNRPTAAELLAGTNTDEAVASVSDIVSLVNTHRLQRSNADPENVGNAAEEGTEDAVSRRDHTHRFPHNNTIQYDETAENFGINIHDVTEHTGQTVRYFTNEDTFTSGGGLSEGQIYDTSGFRKLITKVQLQTSNVLGAHFRVRIKTVDADRLITGDLGRSYAVNPMSTNPHSYPFYDADGNVGIIEEGNQRIAILLEGDEAGDTPALRYGAQASGSPGESYPDASDDFQLVNDVVYADRDPAVGQHSHSHGNDIRGNIKIFYQLIYGHDDLGSEIEPSDAVPQPNTQDGAAGDSDDYSRANHSHPGTAGGGSGESIEVLFDNRADTETALTVAQSSAGGWGSAADVVFTRALVEADDDKDLRIKFRYTQNGLIRSIDELMGAEVLRNFTQNNSTSGSVYPAGGGHPFLNADGRAQNTSLAGSFTRMGIFARGQIPAGEDVLRVVFNTVNNTVSAISEMRGTVELVPRVGGGSSSSQQQVISSRNLATREVVVGDTLIAANNFDFDLAGDDTIAVGRYALNPTPRTDIFDFVGTIRVGGRAGFPIRLSKEQFDYIGEYDIQNTWPFGGTGGGSWGNVTEIPCAMMHINHRTDGVVKVELKPQRQQIGWAIDPVSGETVVLIFFSYNTSGQVDFVEMIVFTDQVVEIEGIHFHYWEVA